MRTQGGIDVRQLIHRGEPAQRSGHVRLPVRGALPALHRHKLLRGPVASVGVEGPHQAHPLSSPQGHQRRARRGARGGDAVLLMLHHPRAGGALQERRSVLGSHIVFDDIAHPQPGHHRAFARVLRARSHAGLHRHHLHVRGVRGASARRSRVLPLHQERRRQGRVLWRRRGHLGEPEGDVLAEASTPSRTP